MPRRSNRMARPHDHLLDAAAAHAKIVDGKPHPAEVTEAAGAEAEPTTGQRRARAQRRNQEGKFA
jgi:hypothetical protein